MSIKTPDSADATVYGVEAQRTSITGCEIKDIGILENLGKGPFHAYNFFVR